MSVEGAVDGKAFENYIERFFAPNLKRGQIVIMDNLSVHKSRYAQRLIEDPGCELLFLPPYYPIEEAFSKVKSLLRKTGARTKEALEEATGHALDAITTEDTRGFYSDCGYRPLL